MCIVISRRFSCRRFMGQVETTHEIVVDVDFLPAVAAGLVRGVDNDFVH